MASDHSKTLADWGFQPFGEIRHRHLILQFTLPKEPAVYVGLLEGNAFWVGQTYNLHARYSDYRRWLALPDDHHRRNKAVRDQLVQMLGGKPLLLHWKSPMQVRSPYTGELFSAHRLEEAMLIEYFKPAWNRRPGGWSKG